VQKQQALRRPPGQGQAPADLEEHEELAILDQLNLSDETSSRIPLKTLLLGPGEENTAALAEYVKSRIAEGHGETLFDLGLDDNGDSMNFTKEEWDTALQRMASACDELKADYKILMTRNVGGEVEVGPANAKEKGACGMLLLRRRPQSVDDVIETRIAVVGNGRSNCGLIGYLLTCDSRRWEKYDVRGPGQRRIRRWSWQSSC
jgi:GTPase